MTADKEAVHDIESDISYFFCKSILIFFNLPMTAEGHKKFIFPYNYF